MPGNATMHRYDLKWLYCNFYHPCAGYLFSISRSALSRKTARVYPHFAGLTFAHNCEEEVRSTDWHIGWRGPLLESFYLYSSPGVVQESQKSTVINTKLGWALFWSSSLPGIFVKHHWEGVFASTTAMVAKTSLLKWIRVVSNFVAFIPKSSAKVSNVGEFPWKWLFGDHS